VYKFAQTSVFSGLNNIQDLTFNVAAGDLCGYTQEEIEANFGPEIDALMEKRQESRADLLTQLKENYNGYVFGYDYDSGKLSIPVYNSFAINTVFSKNSLIQNGWFSTGSSSFLIKQLELRQFEAIQTEKLKIDSSVLINSCQPEKLTIETLLYFAGYVTIKEFLKEDKDLVLHLPNKEVATALAKEIMPRMTKQDLTLVKRAALDVRDAWRAEDFELVKQNLNICLAMLHNRLYTSSESYFHTVIMMYLHMTDMRVEAEVGSIRGDVDLVLWLNKKIYVIEIKMDRSVNEAMKQIHGRKYYTSLLAEKLPITLIGMRCSSKERAIVDLKVEVLEGSK
jgi:hypothetical protein